MVAKIKFNSYLLLTCILCICCGVKGALEGKKENSLMEDDSLAYLDHRSTDAHGASVSAALITESDSYLKDAAEASVKFSDQQESSISENKALNENDALTFSIQISGESDWYHNDFEEGTLTSPLDSASKNLNQISESNWYHNDYKDSLLDAFPADKLNPKASECEPNGLCDEIMDGQEKVVTTENSYSTPEAELNASNLSALVDNVDPQIDEDIHSVTSLEQSIKFELKSKLEAGVHWDDVFTLAEELVFKNVSTRNFTRGLAIVNVLAESMLDVPAKKRKAFTGRQNPSDTGESEILPSETPGIDKAVAADATFFLAALSSSGIIPKEYKKEPEEAVMLLHRAASAGSTEALLALSSRFLQGFQVQKNCKLGLRFAKQAAELISADVEKNMRYNIPIPPLSLRERWVDGGYISPMDPETSPDILRMDEDMALKGHPEAQRRMAYRRMVGHGIDADPEGAFHDFQAAAEAGDPFAVFNLGYMYLQGLFVKQNYTKAMEYMNVSAEGGFGAGYNGMGILHWNGHGTPVNLTAALEAFQKGAALNNSDSFFNMGVMYMNAVGTAKNETKGLECYERALALGHWKSAYLLGLAHADGTGVPVNCTKSAEYFELFFNERSLWQEELDAASVALDIGDDWGALVRYVRVAEQGSVAAAENVAWMLTHTTAIWQVDDALEIAEQYYMRAAAAGSTSSMVELGHLHAGADIKHANASLALHWYMRAADAGSVEGMFYAGQTYQYGLGVQANESAAREFYIRAYKEAEDSVLAIPVILGMAGLWVDRTLAPLVGEHATYQLYLVASSVEQRLTGWLISLLTNWFGGLPGDSGANYGGSTSSSSNSSFSGSRVSSAAATHSQPPSAESLDTEDLLLLLLSTVLLFVLVTIARRAQPNQLHRNGVPVGENLVFNAAGQVRT